MRRSDETPRRTGQEEHGQRASGRARTPSALDADVESANNDASGSDAQALSKTRRKAQMHDLQSLGEALMQLPAQRLAELGLPERLSDAIGQARAITKHEARRRQMQYIGRLMREVDPAPIRARLDHWGEAPAAEKARLAAVERWRERLLADPGGLDALCAAAPHADRARITALVTRVQDERAHAAPPHAYRELFRALNTLLAAESTG
ncbi:MAG: ribosome biogenesis factor YjgA [Betaproteobacteria bacterium]